MLFGATALFGKTVILTESNTLQMNAYYDSDSVAQVIQRAIELDVALPAGEPLFLVINSGGGYISAGLDMINALNGLNRPVHTVTMYAASMGFQTVQGLSGDRLLLDTATLMSHRARGGFFGEFPDGNLDSRRKFWLSRMMSQDIKVVKRNKLLKSVKRYRQLIANEFWCEGVGCLKTGFADKIVKAKCDSSLKGTKMVHTNFVIQGYPLVLEQEYSKCPLQPYVLSWNVYLQGRPIWEKPQKKGEAENSYNNLLGDHQMTKIIIEEARKKMQAYNSKSPMLILK
jgi:ATP-dependent protease ClpP protease subunit